MSRYKITDQQVKKYMKARQTNNQATAAAKAGISERSARRIDKEELHPKSGQRNWRTRPDPLAKVWESLVVPILKKDADITPVGVFDHLCEYHSDIFSTSSRRTLERRIRQWRHLYGSPKEVMFLQTHIYGELGIADFTHIQSLVTIAGEPLKHMLFHYRMPASGWAFAQVIYGGESFAAFSDALQNAYLAAQGVPLKLRTDSLSAAYKNQSSEEDFTERFAALAAHYGFKPTRNNRGVAHENGAIEGPHGHLKAQLEQALKIRGCRDFKTSQDYEAFIRELINRRNRRINDKFKLEQRQLQPLPRHKSPTYTEHYVTVKRTSTIDVKRVTYTVPSRLIQSRLLVRVYDHRLVLFLGQERVLELDRVHTQKMYRGRSINYEHVIDALVKKPRAFRQYRLRDDLLPSDNYKAIWHYLDAQLPADEACYYIVKLLHLAKQSGCERQLETFVLKGIAQRQLPTLRECEAKFLTVVSILPEFKVEQHTLQAYSDLIPGGLHG